MLLLGEMYMKEGQCMAIYYTQFFIEFKNILKQSINSLKNDCLKSLCLNLVIRWRVLNVSIYFKAKRLLKELLFFRKYGERFRNINYIMNLMSRS